jgi:hypothetical protein
MSAAAELRRLLTVLVAALTTVSIAATASAAPAAADFQVFVTVGTTNTNVQVIQSGGAANVAALSFKAGAVVDNDGGEEATARFRVVLPDGLRFGSDGPDPTESCLGNATSADCQTALLIGTDPQRRSVSWVWDIVADRAGSYLLRAEITETSVSDPDLSSNTTSATVVVTEAASPATVSASAVKLAPAKPKAGSVVAATVRVTADGAPVRPARITCAGRVGGAKLRGTARAGSGTATCRYRTPKTAKGKTLRGTMSFTARGKRFTKRFAAKLG